MTTSPGVLAFLIAAAFAAGFIDSIAGGGGLVTLPAFLAAGLPAHLAIATNKGQAVFGAVTSAVSFWRRGALDVGRAPLAFAMGFAGSVVGAMAVLAVRPEPLKPVVLVLLVAVAILLTVRGDLAPRPRTPARPRLALGAMCFGLGVYDGFFGPGVGSMLIVGFALVFGDPLTRASGNAKVVNLASNLAAVAIFTVRGKVLWELALPMAAANALGAAVGARLAVKRGDRFVRSMVLVVVAALVVKVLRDLLS